MVFSKKMFIIYSILLHIMYMSLYDNIWRKILFKNKILNNIKKCNYYGIIFIVFNYIPNGKFAIITTLQLFDWKKKLLYYIITFLAQYYRASRINYYFLYY